MRNAIKCFGKVCHENGLRGIRFYSLHQWNHGKEFDCIIVDVSIL